MFPLMRILIQVVVKKFYERNTGFFLFIFFLMFGVVESNQILSYHLSLIYGFLTTPVFFLIVSIFWSLYILKCVAFVFEVWSLAENSFLIELCRLTKRKQFLFFLVTFSLLYLPVEIYSLFILSVAIQSNYYLTTLLIIIIHFIFLIVASLITVQKTNSTKAHLHVLPSFKWPWPKSFSFFYLNSLLNNHKIILFFTKAFSFFSIIGFMHINLDHYEPGLAMIGLLFGLAAHAIVVFELRKLEDHYLIFARQLPIPLPKRFLTLILVYSLLLLPELILMIVNHIHFIDALICLFAGCSFLIFSHGTLYKTGLNMDKHIRTILYLFLIGFGIVLFKVTLPASALLLILGYYQFQQNYYRYESAG